jgi:hypothetical protein
VSVIVSVTWPKRPFFRAETVEESITKNQLLRGPFLGSVFSAKQSFENQKIAPMTVLLAQNEYSKKSEHED